MKLVESGNHFWYVNPKFPDSPLSPIFDNSALALQWRGRVGQENFGDIEELQKQLSDLFNGKEIVLPTSKEHALAMLQVANFYMVGVK